MPTIFRVTRGYAAYKPLAADAVSVAEPRGRNVVRFHIYLFFDQRVGSRARNVMDKTRDCFDGSENKACQIEYVRASLVEHPTPRHILLFMAGTSHTGP